MRRLASIITVTTMLTATAAYAEDDHHEGEHRHHVAIFGGVGIERGSNDHSESGSAVGLKYHYRLSPRWSIGFDAERIFGNDSSNRDWAFAIPFTYDLSENWKVLAGPGLEDSEFGSDKFLVRVGIAWEGELSGRWTWSPEVIVDILENGDTVYIAGIAIGYGL